MPRIPCPHRGAALQGCHAPILGGMASSARDLHPAPFAACCPWGRLPTCGGLSIRPPPHPRLAAPSEVGTNFTATDELFWEQVRDDALANQNLQQAGAANTRDDFAYALYQHLEELVVNRMDRNGGQAGMFFENPEVRSVIQNWMLDQSLRPH